MNKFHRQTAYAAAFMAAFIFVAWVVFGMMIRPAAAQEPNTDGKAETPNTIRFCPRGPAFPCQDYVTKCVTKDGVTTCKTTILVGGKNI